MTANVPQSSRLLLFAVCRCLAVPQKLSTAFRSASCERPRLDEPRSGLIAVLRLAFGLYLQRRELGIGRVNDLERAMETPDRIGEGRGVLRDRCRDPGVSELQEESLRACYPLPHHDRGSRARQHVRHGSADHYRQRWRSGLGPGALRVMASASPSIRVSAAMVTRWRVPFGLPLGFSRLSFLRRAGPSPLEEQPSEQTGERLHCEAPRWRRSRRRGDADWRQASSRPARRP